MPDEEITSDDELEEESVEESDETDVDEGPKISLPEGIIMVMICLAGDAMDVAGDISAALIPLSWLVDFLDLAVIQIWLIMKGGIGFRKQSITLVGNLVEFIPYLDALPIRTVALLLAIYMINHPKIAGKTMPVKAVK